MAIADARRFYLEADRISTEHPLRDDNGDRLATPATMFRDTRPVGIAGEVAKLDVRTASRTTVDARLPFTGAELDDRQIETEVDELRERKSSLSEAVFDADLEALMVRLATLNRDVENRRQDAN